MADAVSASSAASADWWARPADDVAAAHGVAPDEGLSSASASDRLAQFGPNRIAAEKPPSVWAIALAQLRDPMNIMLVAVTIVSFAIGEVSTGRHRARSSSC